MPDFFAELPVELSHTILNYLYPEELAVIPQISSGAASTYISYAFSRLKIVNEKTVKCGVVLCCDIAANGQYFALLQECQNRFSVIFYNILSGAIIGNRPFPTSAGGSKRVMKFSNNSQSIAITFKNTLQLLSVFDQQEDSITFADDIIAFDFAKDDSTVSVMLNNKVIVIYDLKNKQQTTIYLENNLHTKQQLPDDEDSKHAGYIKYFENLLIANFPGQNELLVFSKKTQSERWLLFRKSISKWGRLIMPYPLLLTTIKNNVMRVTDSSFEIRNFSSGLPNSNGFFCLVAQKIFQPNHVAHINMKGCLLFAIYKETHLPDNDVIEVYVIENNKITLIHKYKLDIKLLCLSLISLGDGLGFLGKQKNSNQISFIKLSSL